MKLTVTGCHDCPCYSDADAGSVCRLSSRLVPGGTPEWCPLKAGPVMVELAEGAK